MQHEPRINAVPRYPARDRDRLVQRAQRDTPQRQRLQQRGKRSGLLRQRAAEFVQQRQARAIKVQRLAQMIGQACLAPGPREPCRYMARVSVGNQIDDRHLAEPHPLRDRIDPPALEPAGRNHRFAPAVPIAGAPGHVLERLAKQRAHMG